MLAAAATLTPEPPPAAALFDVDDAKVQHRERTVPDQIRDMESLLDDGVISQDEFDRFKRGLLE